MAQYGLPVLFALLIWWFSTGLILFLDGLPRRTFRWTMLGATMTLLGALYGLFTTGADTSVGGAYLAFTCALLVWGWHEISFLTGFLTGPRTRACPTECSGWRHFVHAVETILYHELAIIGTAAAVIALTWGAANQVGLWTFVILWVMRLSAKLNLYLGVPNIPEEFLPSHLEFLKRFFSKKPMNYLFPLSVTVPTIVAGFLVEAALIANNVDAFQATGATLLATMLVLAVLEHWLLVLPLPAAALWGWGLRSRTARSTGGEREGLAV